MGVLQASPLADPNEHPKRNDARRHTISSRVYVHTPNLGVVSHETGSAVRAKMGYPVLTLDRACYQTTTGDNPPHFHFRR